MAPLGRVLHPRRGEPISLDREYPIAGVFGFGRGLLLRESIAGADTKYKSLTRLSEGDVVYSKVKAFEGAVTVVPTEGEGRFVSPEFPVFSVDGAADPGYLRHAFGWSGFEDQLRAGSKGIGARRERVHPETFLALEVPLPSLPEQRRIAAHLDMLQKSLSRATDLAHFSRREALAMLPPLTEAVFRHERLPLVRLGELCSNVNRTIHPGDDRVGAKEFVGLEHIEPHTGRRVGSRPLGEEKGRKLLFDEGQVTYGYLRPYLNKVWLTDCRGLCSVEQYVLVPNPGVQSELLAYVLRTSSVRDSAIESTHSLQLPRLRLELLLAIPVPDIRIVNNPGRLVTRLDSLRDRVERIARLAESRTALKGSLLSAARNEVFSAMR